MFCKNCGSSIDDNAVVCPHCGVATGYVPQQQVQQPVQQPINQQGQPVQQPAQPVYQQPVQPVQPVYQQPVVAQQYYVAPPKKVNGLGIAGFVVSLLSLLWLGAFFCITSIVGLVLSIIGMRNRKKCTSCNGLAVAGLVIGIISVVVWGLYWIIAGVVIAAVV